MRTTTSRRRRVAAGMAAAAVSSAIIGAAAPAHADLSSPAPNGGVFNIFLERDILTTEPANAITGGGWWGHEGPDRAIMQTVFSADATDGGTALTDAFGVTDPITQIYVAFAPTSADGSAERPDVADGELIGDAFPWFTQIALGGGWTGNTQHDHVGLVSTQAMYDAWVADGKPDQLIENDLAEGGADLVSHDPLRPGDPVSVAPRDTSVLNTWGTGENISLIYVATTGLDENNEPIVARGADGRAISAWLPFTTVANPDRAAATSGGYAFATEPATPTTTTLTAAPASPQEVGTAVTLDATVSPIADGSVEFLDGSTVLDTVPVDGTGAASLTYSSLAVGSHSLTAHFVPTDAASFAESTSTAVSYEITGVPATPTTTALAVPANATAGDVVTLSATVTPAAAGSIQFKDGSANLGSPVAVDGTGVATLDWTAIVGGHTIGAVFIPADPAAFAASTATPQTIDVAAGDQVSVDDQTIVGEVPAGTITMVTPYTPENPLDLGTLALNDDASQYGASAEFDNITVTDTRAGALPWTATALAGNLTSGSNVINAQNVGLTDLTVVSNNGLGTITTTDNPAADPAVAPADPGSLGLGGATPHTVLQSTAGPGTAVYTGLLTLNAPTSTQAGIYTGTVTFTVS